MFGTQGSSFKLRTCGLKCDSGQRKARESAPRGLVFGRLAGPADVMIMIFAPSDRLGKFPVQLQSASVVVLQFKNQLE